MKFIFCVRVAQGSQVLQEVADVWRRFRAAKARRNVVDFDDLLGLTVALLQKDKGVLSALRTRWKHVLVDEFQVC